MRTAAVVPLALVLASCSPHRPTPPMAEVDLTPKPAVLAAPSASVVTTAQPVASGSSAAAFVLPESYRPAQGLLPCGDTTCQAGTEACCGADVSAMDPNGPKPRCLSLRGLDTPPPIIVSHMGHVGAALYVACEKLTPFHSLKLCEHSGQCQGDDRCVKAENNVADLQACRPPDTSNVEVCSPKHPCKGAERQCLRNACYRKQRSVKCGPRVCGPTEFCYFDGAKALCTTDDPDPSSGFSVLSFRGCDGPEDCLPGQSCCSGTTDRCMYGCAAGDTPTAICANGRRCKPWEEDCAACGAVAK